MNPFRKKTTVTTTPTQVDPTSLSADTPAEYIRRAHAYHAHGDYARAEEDLRKALSMDANATEAYYLLGLNYKSQNKPQEAIQAFEKFLEYVDDISEQNVVRGHMLSRIARGHINQLTKGNWNLREEFWGTEA